MEQMVSNSVNHTNMSKQIDMVLIKNIMDNKEYQKFVDGNIEKHKKMYTVQMMSSDNIITDQQTDFHHVRRSTCLISSNNSCQFKQNKQVNSFEHYTGEFIPTEETLNKYFQGKKYKMFKDNDLDEYLNECLYHTNFEEIEKKYDNGTMSKDIENMVYIFRRNKRRNLYLSSGMMKVAYYIRTGIDTRKKVSKTQYKKFQGEKFAILYQDFQDVFFYNTDNFIDFTNKAIKKMQEGDLYAAFSISNFYIPLGIHDTYRNQTYMYYYKDNNTKNEICERIKNANDEEKDKIVKDLKNACKDKTIKRFVSNFSKIFRDKNSMKAVCAIAFDVDLYEDVNEKIHLSFQNKNAKKKEILNSIISAVRQFDIVPAALLESNNGFQGVIALDKIYYFDKHDYEYYHDVLHEDCGYIDYDKFEQLIYMVSVALGYRFPVDMNAVSSASRIFRIGGGAHFKMDNDSMPISSYVYTKDLKLPENKKYLYTLDHVFDSTQKIFKEYNDVKSLRMLDLFYETSKKSKDLFFQYRNEFQHHKNDPYLASQETLCDLINEEDYENGKKYIDKLIRTDNKYSNITEFVDSITKATGITRYQKNSDMKFIRSANFYCAIPFEGISETSRNFPDGKHCFCSHGVRENMVKSEGNIMETLRFKGVSEIKAAEFLNRIINVKHNKVMFYVGKKDEKIDQYVSNLYDLAIDCDDMIAKGKKIYYYAARAFRVLAACVKTNHHSHYQKLLANSNYLIINAALIDYVNEKIFGETQKLGEQYMKFFNYIGLFNVFQIDCKKFGIKSMSKRHPYQAKSYMCISLKDKFDKDEIFCKMQKISQDKNFDSKQNFLNIHYGKKKFHTLYEKIDNAYVVKNVHHKDHIVADKLTLIACDMNHCFNDQVSMSQTEGIFMHTMSMIMVYMMNEVLPTNTYNDLIKTEQGKETVIRELLKLSKQYDMIFDCFYDYWNKLMKDKYNHANSITYEKKRTFFKKYTLQRYFNDVKFNLITCRLAQVNGRHYKHKEDYCLKDIDSSTSYRDFETYRLNYLFSEEAKQMVKKLFEKMDCGIIDENIMIDLYENRKKWSFYNVCKSIYQKNQQTYNVSLSDNMKLWRHYLNVNFEYVELRSLAVQLRSMVGDLSVIKTA